ncbi:MAG: hypothetical protein OXN17_01965 [Candidatus Poribacteria bacterium]|nr:hypothetical protein [Candidatus Poribacteria bacterium]MDE0506518.1 hypothetical protein [Candidatus Poribacteria bacterium]
MKVKCRIFIVCLMFAALCNLPCIADEIVTVFTFGKIEVLTFGEQEWAFLEKGFVLVEKDLLRMPPDSLIRLQSKDGLLPTLPGGRELSVGTLIADAKQMKTAPRAKRINLGIEHRPMSDVLPVGRPTASLDHMDAEGKTRAASVSGGELAALRMELDALPEEIARLIPELEAYVEFPANEKDNQAELRYPYPMLNRAQRLYESVSRLVAGDLAHHNPALLYGQVLRRSGIEADLVVDNTGTLLCVFDSGIPLESAKRVAANRALIQEKGQTDTVWISVDAQPHKQNFTTAWYEGSEQIAN